MLLELTVVCSSCHYTAVDALAFAVLERWPLRRPLGLTPLMWRVQSLVAFWGGTRGTSLYSGGEIASWCWVIFWFGNSGSKLIKCPCQRVWLHNYTTGSFGLQTMDQNRGESRNVGRWDKSCRSLYEKIWIQYQSRINKIQVQYSSKSTDPLDEMCRVFETNFMAAFENRPVVRRNFALRDVPRNAILILIQYHTIYRTSCNKNETIFRQYFVYSLQVVHQFSC